MAFNYEKHRYECDRCGKRISDTKQVQLCSECERWLDEYVAESRDSKEDVKE